MATLYIATNDLRVEENPALLEASEDERMGIVYCVDSDLFRADRYGCKDMGRNRWRFLVEALHDFDGLLAKYGQQLNLLFGQPYQVIHQILKTHRFDRVIRSKQHHLAGKDYWVKLEALWPSVLFLEVDSSTCFSFEEMNFGRRFPDTFSSFRRQTRPRAFRAFAGLPERLPRPMDLDGSWIPIPKTPGLQAGGVRAAETIADEYFSSSAPLTYKETRNALQGGKLSTGLSAYLAQGCLSPLSLIKYVHEYETTWGKNDSTEWILEEIQWREFFRWYGLFHGEKLYEFSGVKGNKPLTSFYQDRFAEWRSASTAWPIVNACMRELNVTGNLSNRGRMIAASCLINELSLDWRCGARYFQQQLTDYDACSNWGNWQYIAGVGADPRGGRQFNLDKQTKLYDPDGSYRAKWASTKHRSPDDKVSCGYDYYGWPIARGSAR